MPNECVLSCSVLISFTCGWDSRHTSGRRNQANVFRVCQCLNARLRRSKMSGGSVEVFLAGL